MVWRGLASTLCSAVLLVSAFPTYSFYFLAWIALVPLIIACWQTGPKTAWLYGFIFGFAVAHGIFQWMYLLPNIKVHQCLLLAAFVALYPALWCALLSLVKGPSLSVLVFVPASWVVVHYLKSHIDFLSMPWGALAHSQHDFLPIIQIAEFTGEYGVTFLLVLINTALAQFIVTRKFENLVFAGILFLGVYAFGSWSIMQDNGGQPVTIAAVQPARPPRLPNTGPGNFENLEIVEQLITSVAGNNLDLILWPESLLTQWQGNPRLTSRVRDIAANTGIPIVVGVTDIFKFYKNNAAGKDYLEGKQQNSAFFIDPGGKILGPYNKHILVPFAEYTPLEGIVKWPEWLVQASSGLTPGNRRVAFQFKNDVVAIPIICWENLFPDFVRRSVFNYQSVILQLVNDSDFGKSSAPFQHNSASVFRAVENRTPVVISSNTGPSQIIDAQGRIVAEVSQLFEPGTAIGEIVAGRKRTFYNKYGDIFVLFASVLMVSCFCWTVLRACKKIT